MSGDILTILLGFQPEAPEFKTRRDYDQAARAFNTHCANISSSHWLKSVGTPQDLLTVLNPSVNSIAYAFALRHQIAAHVEKRTLPDSLKPGGALWNQLVLFLETFDPVQMRYSGHEWRKLLDYTEQIARASGSPGLAIAPIRSAMIRLNPTTGTFTTFHLAFVQLCMETRSYAAAEPILDNYIYSIPAKITPSIRENLEYSVACSDVATSGDFIHQGSGHTERVTLADLQEYYLLGAMAYLGLRQFRKAQNMLEHVLVAPTSNAASGVMLEAYKKWVLVSCLVESLDSGLSRSSQSRAVPRTANGIAIKQIKSASKAYEAVAEAYSIQSGNMSKLKAQVKAGAEIWAEDGNSGLINEVLTSKMRSYVSRLSRTYSAIPVSNIANSVGGSSDEAVQYLEGLIKDGYLNACLEQSDEGAAGTVLRFFLDPTDGPLAKSEKQQQQALFEQTLKTNLLAEQVKDADYRLMLTKEYVDNVKRLSKKPGAGGDAMDTAWDDGIDAEEDIMTDLH